MNERALGRPRLLEDNPVNVNAAQTLLVPCCDTSDAAGLDQEQL